MRMTFERANARKVIGLTAAVLAAQFALRADAPNEHSPPERVYAQAFGDPVPFHLPPDCLQLTITPVCETTTTTEPTTTTTVTLPPPTTTETQPLQTPDTEQPEEVASAGPNGSYTRHLGRFLVTCYQLHGTTKGGDQAGPGSIAVDEDVIPLGTHLYVDGVGEGVADDTGPAIQGYHIDFWEPDCTGWGNPKTDVYAQ